MDYISSPSAWFLKDKTTIVGLSKQGIRDITREGITSVALPVEKDGVVFDCIQDSFFKHLAEVAPQVEEVSYPPTIAVRVISGTKDDPLPITCSFKRLKILNVKELHVPICHLCFNEALEYIEMAENTQYTTVDGVVYSKEMTGILFYPRSRKDEVFVLPDTVTYIGQFAFKNTKHLKKLVCSKELTGIVEKAFDNSSITELVTPTGTIKEFVAEKEAFSGCQFPIPQEVPAFTEEEASANLLKAALSKDLSLYSNANKYLTSISDEIVDAFLSRMKNEHNRRATIDAGNFCLIMDRVPMTRKLFEVYEYIADYKNWDFSMPTEHVHRICRSTSRFALYRMTGYKGEVQRDKAYDVGCYITGPMPSGFSVDEKTAKEWLTSQIREAIACGKRMFLTKTSIGICCLAAEIIVELKKQYPNIKLVLLPDKEYETENTGFGHWDRMVRGLVYDQKPTEESEKWIPRLDVVKNAADLIYKPTGEKATIL